jgi:hypothetical protein
MAVMKLHNLVFALLGFGLILVQSFLTVLLFLPFGMGTFILCQCMLEVGNLFLIFTGIIAKSLPSVSEEMLDLDFWTMLELLRLRGFLEMD